MTEQELTDQERKRNMKEVMVYTDGACSGNPGPGGWGVVLLYGEHRKELSGAEKMTTNNRMEIKAVIEALKLLKEPCHVKVHSDSAYVVNCFKQGWIKNWLRNGWRNSKNQPVENKELWEELWELMSKHEVEYVKVKGHSDNELNNHCDFLATSAVKNLRSHLLNYSVEI
jgi:ribonuclease HI